MPRAKLLATIGVELPGGAGQYIALSSKASLLDYDVVLFVPGLLHTPWETASFQGKPSLGEAASVQLLEASAHWSREITEALRVGKTVFVLLPQPETVYVDSGQRTHSGTGRNRQTTNIVHQFNTYSMLPFDMKPTTSQGREIALSPAADLLSAYWREFGPDSRYEVLIGGKLSRPLLVTRSGNKPVGGLIRIASGDGTLVLLPHIDFSNERFVTEYVAAPAEGNVEEGGEAGEHVEGGNDRADETLEDGDLVWTDEATGYGIRFRDALLRIDAALADDNRSTPEPDWATAASYTLPKESRLRADLLALEATIGAMSARQQALKEQIAGEALLRGLLYETGTPLERCVRAALELMGFVATPFKDGASEFDVVFEAPEGRFIGEVEGKDRKPINIDKLRQLEMNRLEDFARDDVPAIAAGVLFGNAARLLPPDERGEFFTDKVYAAARQSGTALVRSVDLFRVAQYLSGTSDLTFAASCRRIILESKGTVVTFPPCPVGAEEADAAADRGVPDAT